MQCDNSNSPYLLFIFSYGGNYSPTNVALHGISTTSQSAFGNEMHIMTPYEDPTSLRNNVNVTWNGAVGNAQLVVSHGCPGTTTITPTAVTFNDECGIKNDTYTIPTTTEVNYYVNGLSTPAAPGMYNVLVSGTISVTASAQGGYSLTGTTSWSHDFTNVSCSQDVTPAAVTFDDDCGTSNDAYTIPSTSGVEYQVGGQIVSAGIHYYSGVGAITIDAVAQSGFVLKQGAQASWTYTFTDSPCVTPPVKVRPVKVTFTDLCGMRNDTYTIPLTKGVDYYVNGRLAKVGTYPGSGKIVVVAKAQSGYVLARKHHHHRWVWQHRFSNKACIVTVTPTAPNTITPNCEMFEETVIPPVITGVVWSPSSSATLQPNDSVVYTAFPAKGYTFPQGAQTNWTFTNTFNPEVCEHEPVVPTDPTASTPNCNVQNKVVTLPAIPGVLWSPKTSTTLKPGESVTYTASADAINGYVLQQGAQTSWTFTNSFNTLSCGHVLGASTSGPVQGQLTDTGVSPVISTILALFIPAVATAVLNYKREARQTVTGAKN